MEPGTEGFCTIEEALDELRRGRMIVLVDDPQRENEGDLVLAADRATPEAINFMMRNACGMFCLAMSPAICDRLNLDRMPGADADPSVTPLTLKIDARTGITTGVSAFDRARTVQVAIDEKSTPTDLKRGYGHVDGLRAARAASWCGPATPRAAWTSPAWPASRRPPSFARSSTPTAAWPDCRTSASSATSTD